MAHQENAVSICGPETLPISVSTSTVHSSGIRTQTTPLYYMKPIDIGTWMVESLTSYVANLAKEHHITVLALFRYIILPLLRQRSSVNGPAYRSAARTFRDYGKNLNGINVKTQSVVQIIQGLNKVPQLELTTLLPWNDTFSPQSLLREYYARCPMCLEDQRKSGLAIHDLLIWSMKDVNWCAIHNCTLEECCPCCGKKQYRLSSMYLPGFCIYCNHWLGHSAGVICGVSDSNDQQLREYCVQTISELIKQMSQLNAETGRPSLEVAIKSWIDELAEGKYGRFARITRGTISVWQASQLCGGHQIIALNTLLKASYYTNISLSDLLLSGKVVLRANYIYNASIPKAVRKHRKIDVSTLRKDLGHIIEREPPISLNSVALELGIAKRSIQSYCRELSDQIVERHKTYEELKRQQEGEAIRYGLQEVVHTDVEPRISLRQIGRNLSYDVPTLRRAEPTLCCEISRLYDEYQALKHQRGQTARCTLVKQIVRELHALGEYPSRRRVENATNGQIDFREAVLYQTLKEIRRELGYSG